MQGKRLSWMQPGRAIALVGAIAIASAAIAVFPIPGLIALAALVGIVVGAVRPWLIVVLLAATLTVIPLTAGVQFSQSYPVILPSRPIVLVGICGLVVRGLLVGRPDGLRNPLIPYVAIFVLGAALSIPTSIDLNLSLVRFAGVVFDSGALFVLVWASLEGPAQITKFYGFLLFLSAVAAGFGLVELFTGFNLNQIIHTGYVPYGGYGSSLARAGTTRVMSTFSHPIEFGSYLAFMIPQGIGYLVGPRPLGVRVVLVALIGLLVAALLATVSLGPMVALATGLLVFYLLSRGRFIGAVVGAAVLLAIGVLVAGPGQAMFQDLVLNRFDFSTSSGSNVAGRVAILFAAASAFLARPLVGSGLGTWFLANPTATFAGVSNIGGGAGNEDFYAQSLVEAGLVGTVAFSVFSFGVLRHLWAVHRDKSVPADLQAILLAVFAAFCGFLVGNATANLVYSLQLASLVWISVTAALKLGWTSRGMISSTSTEVHQTRSVRFAPLT